MSVDTAFALGLITSALQAIFVMLSWILTTYLGRRTIYVWGSFINCVFLVALGIAASVGESNSASVAQASLGLIVSVLFCLGPAPASWVIIGETSAIRLRPLTTGIGRGSYYIVNIPCIFLGAYMLNPTVSSSPTIPLSYIPLAEYLLIYLRRAETSLASPVTFGLELLSYASFCHGCTSLR